MRLVEKAQHPLLEVPSRALARLMPNVDQDPPEAPAVLLNPVVQRANMRLVKKAQQRAWRLPYQVARLMSKVHEDPPEVPVVLLDPVVQRANMCLVEKAQHPLLELPAALARNDLDQSDALVDSLLDDPVQVSVDLVAAIIDIMEINDQLCHLRNLAL